MAIRVYPQDSNTDTECDEGATSGDHDLSQTQGTTTTHNTNVAGVTSFTLYRTYQMDVSALGVLAGSQTYNLSLSLAVVTKCDLRVRLAAIRQSDCIETYSSYSATFTAAATETFSLTLNYNGTTHEDLRLEVEAMENNNHGTREFTLDVQDVNTWIDMPEAAAGGGGPLGIIHG